MYPTQQLKNSLKALLLCLINKNKNVKIETNKNNQPQESGFNATCEGRNSVLQDMALPEKALS
jgi:hypothetical protein